MRVSRIVFALLLASGGVSAIFTLALFTGVDSIIRPLVGFGAFTASILSAMRLPPAWLWARTDGGGDGSVFLLWVSSWFQLLLLFAVLSYLAGTRLLAAPSAATGSGWSKGDSVISLIMAAFVGYIDIGFLNVCESGVDPLKFLPALDIAGLVMLYTILRARTVALEVGGVCFVGLVAGTAMGYRWPLICF